ncbi:protein kinase [Achlya hypogyna]|uniref:Protein kinase n=1 Tax=Achlya hypogyna TaxID=1202772 RepID=A0A1V9ZNU3_ACHHY|nr:protein kinase [Achlya hypogyna]
MTPFPLYVVNRRLYFNRQNPTISAFLVKEGEVDFAMQLLHMCRADGQIRIPHKGPKYPLIMDNAVRARSLPLLAELHRRQLGACSKGAMDIAAANGDLEIVQFLHENRTEGASADAFMFAAKRGHQQVLTFLREHRPADEHSAPVLPFRNIITSTGTTSCYRIDADDLELLSVAGYGATAEVWHGLLDGKSVAVKRLLAAHSLVQHVHDFIHEIELTASFKSPAIVQLVGVAWTSFDDLTCVLDSMTMGVGTARWMAPEVLLDHGYTVAADIYSFGMVLVEFATHDIPFANHKNPTTGKPLVDTAIIVGIFNHSLIPSFGLNSPAWLSDLATECISFDPSKRPSIGTVTKMLQDQHELLLAILKYQDGLGNALRSVFVKYHRKLDLHLYLHHPQLRQLQQIERFRGYVLCKLVAQQKVALALQLLEEFPADGMVVLPDYNKEYLYAMDNAARIPNLHLLRRLHERNVGKCSTEAMDAAAKHGDLEMVQFLHNHRNEGCSIRAFLDSENVHPEVWDYLQRHRPGDFNIGPRRFITGQNAAETIISVGITALSCTIQ